MSGAFSVRQRGGVLAGRREGSGEPALVLHGGPGLSDYTAGLVAELAPLLDTIRFQQRGLAPSSPDGPFTVEAHVEDALAVLDGLGVDRAWAVGHSWGAHLAMHLAAAAPERLLGLVAVDPLGAVPDGGEEELERNIESRLSPEEAGRMRELDRRLLAGGGTPDEATEVLRIGWPHYFADPDTAPPMPEMRMSVAAYGETWESIRAHFSAGTLVEALPRFDRPALFVHGRESPIPWQRSDESAALVPGGRLEILQRCGHFPWLEQPGAVRTAVASFLAT